MKQILLLLCFFWSFGAINAQTNSLILDQAYQQLQAVGVSTQGFANGELNDVKQLADGSFICVGTFTHFNDVEVGGIVKLQSNGQIDGSFVSGVGFGSSPRASVVLPLQNGQFFVGGMQVYQNTYSGTAIPTGYCIINANGTLDNSIVYSNSATGINNTGDIIIDAVELSNGNILVGGKLPYISGSAANHLAIINRSNGTIALASNSTNTGTELVGVFDGRVYSIHRVSDNEIYIGGNFRYQVNGKEIKNVMKVNASLIIDASFSFDATANLFRSPNQPVKKVYSNSAGAVFIGGDFTQVGTTAVGKVAKLLPTGLLDAAFSTTAINATQVFKGLAINNLNEVYFSATNLSSSTQLYNANVYKLATNGTIALQKNYITNHAQVLFNILSDQSLILFGGYTRYENIYTNRISKLDAALEINTAFNNHRGLGAGKINAVTTDENGRLYVAGAFSGYGTTPTASVIRFNTDGSLDETFSPAVNSTVNSILYIQNNPSRLVVAEGTKIRVFNATNGAIYGTNSYTAAGTGEILSMVYFENKLYVGGNFTDVAGKPYFNRLNFTSSTALSAEPSTYIYTLNGPVNVIKATQYNGVFVGGNFTTLTENGISTPHNYGGVFQLNQSHTLTSWMKNAGFRYQAVAGGTYSNARIYDFDFTNLAYPSQMIVVGRFTEGKQTTAQAYITNLNGIAKINGFDNSVALQAYSFANKLQRGEEATKIVKIDETTFLVAVQSQNGYGGNTKSKKLTIIDNVGALKTSFLDNISADLVDNDVQGMSAFHEGSKSIFVAGKFSEVFGSERNGLARLLLTIPAPVALSIQEFCVNSNPTVADISFSGATEVNVYDAENALTPLTPSTPLVSGSTYYLASVNAGTESATRTPVSVTILSNYERTDIVNVCGSYTWINGVTYNSSTSGATFLVEAEQGSNDCDTLVTLNLTILPTFTSTQLISACESYTWPLNGQTYTTSTTEQHILQAQNGCDSTVTLELTILRNSSNEITETVCNSYTWNLNQETYTESGMYSVTIPNRAGCDSVVTLNLTVNPIFTNVVNEIACGSFIWNVNNIEYTSSTSVTEVLQSVHGCDSTVTLNLTINQPSPVVAAIDSTVCGPLVWNGNIYETSGVYTELLQNVAGCDSSVTINLTVLTAPTATYNVTNCGPYVWYGSTYSNSGTYTTSVETSTGCDSLLTLNLIVNAIPSVNITNNANVLTVNQAGATYQWLDCTNGNALIDGATSQTLIVTENGSYAVEVTLAGCTNISLCEVVSNVSLTEIENASINLYPNPTTGKVTVDLGNVYDSFSVEVLNTTGQVVEVLNFESTNSFHLNVNGAKGIYTLKIHSEREVIIKKVILQ